METMKRKWGKPVTEVQQFVPQYCTQECSAPANMIWSPVPETNGLGGWQEHGTHMPTGYTMDNKHLEFSGLYLGVTTFEKRHISSEDDTYEYDDNASYWEIQLTGPAWAYRKKNGKYVKETGYDWIVPGKIFYRNYPDNVTFDFDVDKNFS